MKEQTKAKDLDLFNVFHIKGRTCYYNQFDKKLYIVTDEFAGRLQFFSTRHSIAILICLIMMSFTKNYFLCLLVSLIYLLITSFLFYKVFLVKLQEYDALIDNKESTLVRFAKAEKTSSIGMNIFCCFLTTTTIIVNTIKGVSIGNVILNYLVALVFAIYGIFQIILLTLKKR